MLNELRDYEQVRVELTSARIVKIAPKGEAHSYGYYWGVVVLGLVAILYCGCVGEKREDYGKIRQI